MECQYLADGRAWYGKAWRDMRGVRYGSVLDVKAE
jgi:hypothetical protein